MPTIASSAVRTCFGDGEATYASLLAGACGVSALPADVAEATGTHFGYRIQGDPTSPQRPEKWLASVVGEAATEAGLAPGTRLPVIVGTGLGQQSYVERWAIEPGTTALSEARFDFEEAVRAALPNATTIITLNGACSASGSALALAGDMIAMGTPMVMVAGVDAMTTTMLAMIGGVGDTPTERVQPFDRDRRGVLLGDGACAVLVTRDDWTGPSRGRLLATGLSCDAFHETAPHAPGILRAIQDAYHRAGRAYTDVQAVIAHGTGTLLNDPVESAVLADLSHHGKPVVTALKGSVGHTSGGSALLGVDVALRMIATSTVPPVVGLSEPIPEAGPLALARNEARNHTIHTVQVNAFGFGGVNAVSLVGRAPSRQERL